MLVGLQQLKWRLQIEESKDIIKKLGVVLADATMTLELFKQLVSFIHVLLEAIRNGADSDHDF